MKVRYVDGDTGGMELIRLNVAVHHSRVKTEKQVPRKDLYRAQMGHRTMFQLTCYNWSKTWGAEVPLNANQVITLYPPSLGIKFNSVNI